VLERGAEVVRTLEDSFKRNCQMNLLPAGPGAAREVGGDRRRSTSSPIFGSKTLLLISPPQPMQ